MNKLLVISGPTATGKTALACEVAKLVHGELISADSRQLYQGMDIITGKDLPSKTILKSFHLTPPEYNIPILNAYSLKGIPLWMYDVIPIDTEWSVSHYHALVTQLLADIQKRDVLPILVGGTGLYIKSILETMETVDIPRNSFLREHLSTLTLKELQEKLQYLNCTLYNTLNNSDKHNPRRLMRKIEIEEYTSQHPSFQSESHVSSSFDVLHIHLSAPDDYLAKRIASRVEERIQQGAIQEVQSLTAIFGWNHPAFDAIGYREWKEYVDCPSKEAFLQAKTQWISHEIAYTKKQITWFNKERHMERYSLAEKDFRAKIREKVQLWYTTKTEDSCYTSVF